MPHITTFKKALKLLKYLIEYAMAQKNRFPINKLTNVLYLYSAGKLEHDQIYLSEKCVLRDLAWAMAHRSLSRPPKFGTIVLG